MRTAHSINLFELKTGLQRCSIFFAGIRSGLSRSVAASFAVTWDEGLLRRTLLPFDNAAAMVASYENTAVVLIYHDNDQTN